MRKVTPQSRQSSRNLPRKCLGGNHFRDPDPPPPLVAVGGELMSLGLLPLRGGRRDTEGIFSGPACPLHTRIPRWRTRRLICGRPLGGSQQGCRHISGAPALERMNPEPQAQTKSANSPAIPSTGLRRSATEMAHSLHGSMVEERRGTLRPEGKGRNSRDSATRATVGLGESTVAASLRRWRCCALLNGCPFRGFLAGSAVPARRPGRPCPPALHRRPEARPRGLWT